MKTRVKFSKQILSVLLCIAMLMSYVPMTAHAATASTPTIWESDNLTHYFANGTPLYIVAGTSSGTAIYYMNGSQKVYMNNSSAAGDDLSNVVVWGGYEYNVLDGDANITMTGGTITRIIGGGYDFNDPAGGSVNNVNITISGGTVSEGIYAGWCNPVNGNVNITMTGGSVGMIYCCCRFAQENVGNNAVKVNGNVNLRITGGSVGQIYSGDGQRPINGTVSALITVPAELDHNNGFTTDKTYYFDNLLFINGSNWVQKGNVTINADEVLTVAAGQTMTVPNGATLTNNGTIVNNGGTITVYGKLEGNAPANYVKPDFTFNTETLKANTSTTLSAAVCTPSNPVLTQRITYEIVDKGTTEAVLSGRTITPYNSGTVKIKVTMQDGYCTPISKTFDFPVSFTKVTEISGTVPTEAWVNMNVTLPSMVVSPEDASYKTVVWSVVNANGTGATLSGSTLKATNAGTATIRATIENGTAYGTDFIKDYSINFKSLEVVDISLDRVTIKKKDENTVTVKYVGFDGGSRDYGADEPIYITGQRTETRDYIIDVYADCTIVFDNVRMECGEPLVVYNRGVTVNLRFQGTNEIIGTDNGYSAITSYSKNTIIISGDGILKTTKGIGGSNSLKMGTVIVNSGTLNSNIGQIGGGGNVIITGGSISGSIKGTVTNGTENGNQTLAKATITLNGVGDGVSVSDIDIPNYYSTNGVVTMDGGKIYLWLPADTMPTCITLADGTKYICKDSSNTYYTSHEWSEGTCSHCNENCDHNGATSGTCGICGKTLHTHTWEYKTDGTTTIVATCVAADCDNTNGGSVTLVAKDGYYTGSSVGASVEGAFTNGATYKVTYNDGSENAPSSVGTHTAKLTVYENGTEKANVSAEHKITYLEAPESAYIIKVVYKKDNTYYFKAGESVTVDAPAGYEISKKLGSGYGSSVTFAENDNKVVYLKRTSDGAMTEAITISETMVFDGDGATGKITITNRGFWEKLFNRITFGLFFKGDVVATVTADDSVSGVASIQYYVASEDLINNGSTAALDALTWTPYEDEIALNENAKNVVYIKITDNVGNVTYLSSEGIVLYSDAEADTESVSTTYKVGADKEVTVKLNGNTVKEIKNGTTVVSSDNYTVSADGKITLKGSYLDTLNAGTYTFTVSYNPLGLDYVEAKNNEAPATTNFKVVIEKAEGNVSDINISGKTYDGTPVSAPTYDKLGDGVATIEYKVKGADDSTYTTTAPSNAGTYVVRVTVAEGANYKEAYATAEFEIKKAGAEIDDNPAAINGLVYNGNPQALVTAGSTDDGIIKYSLDGVAYSTSIPEGTNAGTYTVYVKIVGDENHNDSDLMPVEVKIGKATVTEPTIASKPYTGSAQSADVFDTVLYTVERNDGNVARGRYEVVLKLRDADNYKWSTTDSAEVTLTFEITKAENTWLVAPSISGWTYGEDAKAPTYEAKFGNSTVKVTYTGKANDGSDYSSETAPTKAGNYTATFTVAGTADYNGLSESVDFTIAKATYDMSSAKWNYTDAFKYDGKEHKVEVVGLPSGVAVGGYNGNTATVVGDYTAKVTLTYDANNYNAPSVADLNWKVENNWTPSEYTVNGNDWMNQDFVITANNGYKVSLINTADGEWKDSLTYSAETDNGSVTFYLKNETDGTISLAKTVTYKLDKTAPTGKVEFVDRTGWQEFVNTITFGLFYKDEVTVKITSADNLSGVAKVEYYASNEGLTLDEVKAITDWTAYSDSFGVSVEDTKKFVYYVRITDNAGNVTYLSTDGAEYDITAPVISGIECGATYYTTQKVTVTDKNLDTVTLNGNVVNGTVTLDGKKDVTYTIVATDKAGNSTTVTVTMKPISDLSAPIDALNKDNVNSGNEQAVDGVKTSVAAVDTSNATDDEKAALKEIADKAAELEKVIDDTKAEIARIDEELNKHNGATVTSDDKADLEQLLADIEKQLESTNLTEEEISELNGDKKAVEDLLTKIKGTDELIDKLTEDVNEYSDETVKSTDKDAIEQIIEDIDALLETENLTDDEKKALEDAKDKAEGLLEIIDGADKATDTENTEKVKDITAENVTPEDKTNLEKAKADLEKALEDYGDNYTDDEKKAIEDEIKRIDDALEVIENVENVEELIGKIPENITKNDEAAIKAADDAYNALTDYEKSLVDEDAKKALDDAKAALAELNKPTDSNSPQTGDNSNHWLWFALLFVSGAGVFGITLNERKRRTANKR